MATKKDLEQLETVLTLHVESTAHQLRTEMSRGNVKVIASVVVAILGQPIVQAAASHIR